MPKYELLIDGRRRWKAPSAEAARDWIRDYCREHAEDDPDAVHVQVRELTRWSWLTGGTLVPRERFFDARRYL